MASKINKENLNKFQKAHREYQKSFKQLEILEKSIREKISDHLLELENRSSVEIEHQQC
ncbi:MAG: hypothetical protein WC445_00150 [Patescibacteria group bacterium]